MSTTYPLNEEIEITEQSSKFYFSVRLPLLENDLDHDWHHTDYIEGKDLLLMAARLIESAGYAMGESGRKEGELAILAALEHL